MLYPDDFSLQRVSTSLGTLIAYRKDESLGDSPHSSSGSGIAVDVPTVDVPTIDVPTVDAPTDSPTTNTPTTDSPKTTLAFLHGFGGGSSSYEWSYIYPAFTADYSVMAFDLLGWGRSHHLDRDYRLDDYLSNLQELLATLKPAPIVVASSLTAAMMIRLAAKDPDCCRALLLVSPSGLSDFGEDYSRSPFAQLVSTPVLDRIFYTTLLATPFGIRSFLENRQYAQRNRISNEVVDAYLASAQQPGAEYSALSFVRGDLCFDVAEDVPQLTVPTAIFWGQQAQFTSVELGKRLAALNPQAIQHFEVIPDTGLTPQLELPAVLIGKMRQVLRSFGL